MHYQTLKQKLVAGNIENESQIVFVWLIVVKIVSFGLFQVDADAHDYRRLSHKAMVLWNMIISR